MIFSLLQVLKKIISVAFYKPLDPLAMPYTSNALYQPKAVNTQEGYTLRERQGGSSPTPQTEVRYPLEVSELSLTEPKYKFICVKAANKFVDGKILNDYVHYSVMADPKKLKFVVKTLIRGFKLLNIKKHDTAINKS